MKHLWLTLALAVAPLPGWATCTGIDYLTTLDADTAAALDAVVAQTPYANGLVWEARKGPDLLTVIGTIHIFDPRLAPLFVDLAPTVGAAEVLLVEAGPEEEATMQAAMAATPELIFITEGPTLPEQLPEDAWQAVADAARDRQIPPVLAAKMQPWYLSLTLALPACAMPDMLAGVRGLDHLLMEKAAESGVPIKAVEPWDTLFTLMRTGTPAEQLEMLQMGLLPSVQQSQMYVAMLNSYFAGDVARIWEASRIASRDIPGLDPDRADALFAQTEELLLNQRNRAWMAQIAAAAAQHDTFVLAVGAAHLPGEVGVLNLLAADGWTLTPVD